MQQLTINELVRPELTPPAFSASILPAKL